ncbi:hypothetical protein OSB04_012054 [Centaurea solstitialis]|uniref:Pentatricopeptide repeat-containing protein n=1 Tax=Centaurea solstitialis TaxID=347529 RepID=A0AA38TME9_9ASTR|nr:hypothetical protein OSB04_012054 [Centaurea solstitialis]
MIKGLCNFVNDDIAISLLRLMDQRGCKPDVMTYSTIKEEVVDDALKLFNEMILHKSILPNVVNYSSLIHGLCSSGRWADAAVTKMQHYSCSIHLFKQMTAIGVPVDVYTTAIVINTLLNGLILEDRILEAERLFKKLIKGKLCEPDVVMYSTMIKGLCKVGLNDTAIALLRLMNERGCKPNVMTYNTIIDSLCKDKMIDDALKLFNEMIFHKGILPDVVTYNTLIHGFCNQGRWDDASKMLREMEDERMSPNVITYSILVDAFCKEGMVEDAEAVLNIMVERGKVPDLVTYSSLIDGFCLRGELKKAKEIFDLMKIRGHVPDIVTYNSLLNGYCKKSKIDEALHLFHEITEKGMKPDVITYNTMLQGLFRVGRYKDALELFNEMRMHNQIPPDAITYGIVLEGLCNNHQVDEALSLFRMMCGNELNLDIVLYNILIDGASKCGKPDIAKDIISCFCREGQVREATELFFQMEERGCPPNCVTYNVLLQGLLKNGQYDMIEMWLKKMDAQGFSVDASACSMLLDHISSRSLDGSLLKLIGKLVPKEAKEQLELSAEKLSLYLLQARKRYETDVVTYNTMLQGLFRVGRCKDARELFNEMKAHIHIPPGAFTYGIVLEGLCNNHQLDEALSLFRLLSEKKLSFDIVVYNILIDGASKCGKLDIAKVLFNDLCARGFHPDVWTYNAMICGFCREGLVRESKELFQKMAEVGCVPDRVTYNILLQGLLKNGQHDTIKMLLEEMDGKGFSIDASTCSMLIDHISSGSLDNSLLKLIGKLVPKEGKEAACLESI